MVQTSSTGYSFDKELVTAVSTSSVTMTFTSHAQTLSILALGVLSLTVGPPANSTAIVTCVGPPA